MKVLVAGLTSPSAMAVEMIVRSVWRGAEVLQHLRGDACTPLALAADARRCDLSVIDLHGLGFGARTPEREAALNDTVLGDRPAVLLLPAGRSDWSDAAMVRGDGPPRIALQQPASMTHLLDALVAIDGRRRPARSAPPLPAPARAAPRRADPAPRPPRAAAAPAPPSVAGPRPADRAAVLAACPGLRAQPFVQLVLDIVERGEPSAFSIGQRSGAVFCPAQNWVASSIPTALRRRLTQHRLMLGIVDVHSCSEAQAEVLAAELSGRRGDARRELDGFLFGLLHATYADEPPEVDGALRLRLTRFPNVTRLQGLPDLFVQLSLVTLQRTRSVHELRRAFPRHDAGQVSLFALCAVLSGMAEVDPLVPQPVVAAPPPPSPPRRGLVRALLARLF